MDPLNLISISDHINKMFSDVGEMDRIRAPELILVGSQSAGKSSLINNIVKRKVSPTNSGITTRCPIHYRIRNGISNDISISSGSEILFCGKLNDDENFIVDKIIEITNRLIPGLNITVNPIYVSITYEKAPNVSFVDLPGLVTIAKTDQGQPLSMVSDIRAMAKKYIVQKHNIVLTVIEAKTDLETDLGLSFVKEIEREQGIYTTIGVLTKPDLSGDISRVNDILDKRVSTSVLLDHGYFVVNNVCINEEQFFRDVLGRDDILGRCGSQNLLEHITKLLNDAIMQNLPSIKMSLHKLKTKMNDKLKDLGEDLTTVNAQISLLSKILGEINIKINSSIESEGIIPNMGFAIRKEFERYLTKLKKINPFENYDDKYYSDIINSFESFRIVNNIDISKILEKCINNTNTQPLRTIIESSMDCVDSIIFLMLSTIRVFIDGSTYNGRYKRLTFELKKYYETHITNIRDTVLSQIIKFAKNEQSYINTVDEKFLQFVGTYMMDYTDKFMMTESILKILMTNTSSIENISDDDIAKQHIDFVRKMCSEYFKTISISMYNNVIKVIMCDIVRETQCFTKHGDIYEFITLCNPNVFVDDDEIVKEREYAMSIINKLMDVEKLFSVCS
jgi:dynamin 1-like protein